MHSRIREIPSLSIQPISIVESKPLRHRQRGPAGRTRVSKQSASKSSLSTGQNYLVLIVFALSLLVGKKIAPTIIMLIEGSLAVTAAAPAHIQTQAAEPVAPKARKVVAPRDAHKPTPKSGKTLVASQTRTKSGRLGD